MTEKYIMYKIHSPISKDFYIGSTKAFRQRKSQHKCACNSDRNNLLYTIIRETGGWSNWEMNPIEEFICASKTEAQIREQYWIEKLQPTLNCVNAYVGKTQKERNNHCLELFLKLHST